jgi:hypothetical protein
MTAADSDDFAVDQPRSRLTVAALVGLPILGNLLLAAFLFSTMPTTPGSGPSLPFVPGPVEVGVVHDGVLDVSSFDAIVTAVRSETGAIYNCFGPWRGGGGTFNWACRARDSLATMHAGPDGHIYSIRTTWFGFDPSSMDPTVWADAIFPAAADRDGSRQWLREHFGRRDGTQIGRTKIEVGGSRGAYVMTLST